jgi:hypothetical protein
LIAAILGIQGRDFPGKVPEDRQMLENKVRSDISGGCPRSLLTPEQSDYAQVILEKPLYALMKMSVLFFYRRIFTSHRRFLNFNTFMIALIGVWSLAYMIAEIFVCGATPWVLWTPGMDPNSVCVNRNDLNFTYAISDVIGDIMVVFMPFPVIRSLHMDGRQKMGVAIIFLLGALSTAASILRLGFISVAFTQNYGAFGVNIHKAGTPPSVWSTVEGAVGVLAACLPPLGPLIRQTPASQASRKIYDRLVSRRASGKSPKGSSYPDQFVTPQGSVSHNYRTSSSWYSKHIDSRKGSFPFGSRQGSAPPESYKGSLSTKKDMPTISLPFTRDPRNGSHNNDLEKQSYI